MYHHFSKLLKIRQSNGLLKSLFYPDLEIEAVKPTGVKMALKWSKQSRARGPTLLGRARGGLS